jgi:hypothetical protein
VEERDQLGVRGHKLVLERLAEETVTAVPLSPAVERDEQHVRPFQINE